MIERLKTAAAGVAAGLLLAAGAPLLAAPTVLINATVALRLQCEPRLAEPRTAAIEASRTSVKLETNHRCETPVGDPPLLKTSGAGGGGGSRIWVASVH
jgi:hypothetical protein